LIEARWHLIIWIEVIEIASLIEGIVVVQVMARVQEQQSLLPRFDTFGPIRDGSEHLVLGLELGFFLLLLFFAVLLFRRLRH